MTYCLGIKVGDGLIGLADGRITSGNQLSSARKITMMSVGSHRFFVMNSGLRSVRDKTLAYLRQDLARLQGDGHATMYKVVTLFSECLRRVAVEDREALEASGLTFNLHALIGGQLSEDAEPSMFLIYPEGNWIEVDQRSPYLSIGATAYGKPILDRALRYQTSLRAALKIAYLSFDSSRFSSTDVGYPLDLITYHAATGSWRETTFEYDDLVEQRQWWNKNITELAQRVPDGPWVEKVIPPELITEAADRSPSVPSEPDR
ncbi:MAG: peptidase [Azospirillum sp.]|nr:peptidase [Azospirillum sp.]